MSIRLPHITADNAAEYLRQAAVNLHVAAARLTGVGTLVLHAVNDPQEDGAAADLARQRLLAYHGEASRSIEVAATLIADAWDFLDVTLVAYNQMACTLIGRTAMLARRAHDHETGMQRYEGVIIMGLAKIVSELLDSLQECLDVPLLPDPYEISSLPWAQAREQFVQVVHTYERLADALQDTENAIRILTHAP